MGGVREEVDELARHEVVARLGEEPGVAAEGGRVAADEHHPARRRWRRPCRRPWRRGRCGAGRRRRRRPGAGPSGRRRRARSGRRASARFTRASATDDASTLDERSPVRPLAERAGEEARRRRRGRRGGRPAASAVGAPPRTASTSASAPSGRAWKNERAEIRQRRPASSSWNQARRPARELVARRRPDAVGHPRRGRATPCTMTRRSPVPGPARRTTSPSGKRRRCTSSSTSGWATRHGPIVDDVVAAACAGSPNRPATADAPQRGAVARWPGAPGPRRR